MNILVVDPDRVSRRLAALLIERIGCPSPTLADSAEALPAGDWSLALIDVGFSIQTLRSALGARTRLVVMAAQDFNEARRAHLQAGADEVLAKPLTREALAGVIARASSDIDDFNPANWASLRELFGAVGVARLCATLVDDLPVQQSRFADAVRDNDLAALKSLAHTLRGVSQQLGAAALAQQWTLAEQAAVAGDATTSLRLGADLMNRYAAVVERLRHESAAT
jgi:CheY-like chemotaxis protein